MKFMLSINDNEKVLAKKSEAELHGIVDAHNKFAADCAKAGKLAGGERLRPSNEAVRVVKTKGRHDVIDGPFAEAKEVCGGYYIVDVASKQEAIEWAKKIPLFGDGADSIDVREIWQM